MKRGLVVAGIFAAALVATLLWGVGSYNRLVALDQAVESQWAQVENVYQRRADLVPNLVAVVQGAASHERETLLAVTEARAKVGQIRIAAPYDDPDALTEFEAAQNQLSSAIARLLVVAESYPDLKANQNFLALQSQLEGTENRITVERMRFNDAARDFNTKRETFPTAMLANMFGGKFASKAYFHAQAGSEAAPKVELGPKAPVSLAPRAER